MNLKYPYRKQEYNLKEDHVELILTQGKVGLIDFCDLEATLKHKWSAMTDGFNWYAVSNLPRNKKLRHRTMKLHRYLMTPEEGMSVDHLNHNGLDNRRSNLKVCTHAENTANKKLFITNKTGVIGICEKHRYSKRRKEVVTNFVAQYCKNYKRYSKFCKTMEEAVQARKEMESALST